MDKFQNWKLHLWWLWLSFIFIVSVIPSYNSNTSSWFGQFHFDKLFHLLSHAIAIFFIVYAINASKTNISRNIKYILVLLFMLLFGVFIECLQGNYVPGRMFDVADIAANTVGDVLGLLLVFKCGKS